MPPRFSTQTRLSPPKEATIVEKKEKPFTRLVLLLVRLRLVVHDAEVPQLVRVLVAGDHVQVVAKLLLLEVLLGKVLEVPLGERRLGGHGDARLRCVHKEGKSMRCGRQR